MSTDTWLELMRSKPHELSNAKLDEFMQLAWQQTAGNMQAGNVYEALLSEKEARQNKTTIRWSLFLSILAVSFALFSLFFSVLDWRGDKTWQSAQMKELQIQSSYLMKIANSQHKAPNKALKSGTPQSGAP
ncbi:MAG: hypothetical protein KZQ93_13730 [Candidatus Thiodiazotropha sp. (ex Monitilora ramsayi)]|nr:hypothetical protein [Candidatus Thiodiazotropha sp. (ex Monitilora ramsayi)]